MDLSPLWVMSQEAVAIDTSFMKEHLGNSSRNLSLKELFHPSTPLSPLIVHAKAGTAGADGGAVDKALPCLVAVVVVVKTNRANVH